jgi:NADH-quinone oxidoreductase subunit N
MTDLALIAPEIFLAAAALVLLLLGSFGGHRSTLPVIILGVLALALTASELLSNSIYQTRTLAFDGLLITDGFAVFAKIIILVGLIGALLMSYAALRAEMIARFEYPVLVILSGVGMMLMVSSHHFLMLYVALELSSLALYVLAAFRRQALLSAEAAMKYFILGALSSGMLLFGISLIYGFTGTVAFDGIHRFLAAQTETPPGVVVGMAFVLAGLAFKISAVPFHMWVPDVYQGAPSPVTALFAMVPKIAALALLIRVLFHPFGTMVVEWQGIVVMMAVASMVWGAFAAVRQTNIKRMLAYGSIANMGYALIGLVVVTPAGIAATMMYMVIYLVMTAGAFAVLLTLRRDQNQIEDIRDLAGLSKNQPIMAYALALMMFAMAGLPPLAGFFGKLVIFNEAVGAGYYTLAVVGVLASVVAAYYYLNVIRMMFFAPPAEPIHVSPDAGQQFMVLVTVVLVVILVLAPQPLYDQVLYAATTLFPDLTARVGAAP